MFSAPIPAKIEGQCRAKFGVPRYPWASVKHKVEEGSSIYYPWDCSSSPRRGNSSEPIRVPEKDVNDAGAQEHKPPHLMKLNVRIKGYGRKGSPG